jgi:hypothetical protein
MEIGHFQIQVLLDVFHWLFIVGDEPWNMSRRYRLRLEPPIVPDIPQTRTIVQVYSRFSYRQKKGQLLFRIKAIQFCRYFLDFSFARKELSWFEISRVCGPATTRPFWKSPKKIVPSAEKGLHMYVKRYLMLLIDAHYSRFMCELNFKDRQGLSLVHPIHLFFSL